MPFEVAFQVPEKRLPSWTMTPVPSFDRVMVSPYWGSFQLPAREEDPDVPELPPEPPADVALEDEEDDFDELELELEDDDELELEADDELELVPKSASRPAASALVIPRDFFMSSAYPQRMNPL